MQKENEEKKNRNLCLTLRQLCVIVKSSFAHGYYKNIENNNTLAWLLFVYWVRKENGKNA